MLVDTHCHLNFDSFDIDRAEVLRRARAAGVQRILVPGIDLESSQAALALAESIPQVFAAVGFHPNDLSGWGACAPEALLALAGHPKCVAIGEIGLDYYWEKSSHTLQQQAFAAQLELAARLHKPVIVHVRNASPNDQGCLQDALALLCAWQAGLSATDCPLALRPGVLHSYSGDWLHAERLLAANFYLGISGPVTFRKAEALHLVVAQAPAERLLLETDAPFLTPHPHRGQRNEPAYAALIAEKIAALRGLAQPACADILTSNAERLFHWRTLQPV